MEFQLDQWALLAKYPHPRLQQSEGGSAPLRGGDAMSDEIRQDDLPPTSPRPRVDRVLETLAHLDEIAYLKSEVQRLHSLQNERNENVLENQRTNERNTY